MRTVLRVKVTVFPLFLLLACVPCFAGQVRIEKSTSGWSLSRNGEPYFVRGAGGVGDLAEFAACGGNSIRTWGADRAKETQDEPVADKDWGAEDVSSWGGRLKQMGAEEPKGLTWQPVATGEVLTDIQSGVEEIVLPKFEKTPTYIRVRDLYKGQLYEVQLRTCRRPSGFAIKV